MVTRKLFSVFALLLCVGVLAALWREPLVRVAAWAKHDAEAAAVFFVESISINQLRLSYASLGGAPTTNTSGASQPSQPEKIKILIVPGHEPESGGTEYGGYAERDIVVDIADDLAALLRSNPHYDVTIARSKDAWNPILSDYFNQHAADIAAFRAQQENLMLGYEEAGRIVPEDAMQQIDHHTAADDVALRLYGINKWADENGIDIMLHLHINDYAGRRGADGYTGFAVYIPEHQYSNANASRAIGDAVAARLNAYHATSTMPQEAVGVIEDQQLIAIGSNNSADSASVLIEYGYIYERQFRDPAVRALAESEYAYQTYLGLQDFFKDPASSPFGTNVLPTFWSTVPTPRTTSPDAYALQTALHRAGLYPAPGQSFSDCPITGYFGPCTTAALQSLERGSGVLPTGQLDTATLAQLRSRLAGMLALSLPTFQ